MPGFFSHINHADTATLSAINPYTGTAATMLRPLTELQIALAKGLMRGPINGTGSIPASLEIRADLGSIKPVHCVGLIGCNGATTIVGVVQLSNVSPGAGEVGGGSVEWSADVGAGTESASLWWFPDVLTIQARYVSITATVYALPSGKRHVDARRLWIGAGGATVLGYDSGWSVTPEDPSVDTQTPKGGVFLGNDVPSRILTFSMLGRAEEEIRTATINENDYDSIERTILAVGKRKEIVANPYYSADVRDYQRNVVYGRFTGWGATTHSAARIFGIPDITVKEIPHRST